MISFPDKITPLPKSIIGNMLIVLEELKGSNQTLELLSYKLKNKLDILHNSKEYKNLQKIIEENQEKIEKMELKITKSQENSNKRFIDLYW